MSVRNHKKRGFIDRRDALSVRRSETDTMFKVTVRISQTQRETQTIPMRNAAMPNNTTEKQRTYWQRFLAACGINRIGHRL